MPGGPMRQELDKGFALFVMGANLWAEIPEKDRASVWHVGAITGEALSHAALKLRAEAWTRAAEGGFDIPKGTAPKPADHDSAASVQPVTFNGGNGKNPEPQFPKRASWLRDRLLERGWGNSDPSKYRGPDRKTVEKILRGEVVRNDEIDKLADALSSKPPKVSVLDIPQD